MAWMATHFVGNIQCCCQGLETQGQGKDKDLMSKDEDKDKDLSFEDKDKDKDLHRH